MQYFSVQTPEKMADLLAGRLRTLRLASGLKQSTLAERAGVSLGSRTVMFGSSKKVPDLIIPRRSSV